MCNKCEVTASATPPTVEAYNRYLFDFNTKEAAQESFRRWLRHNISSDTARSITLTRSLYNYRIDRAVFGKQLGEIIPTINTLAGRDTTSILDLDKIATYLHMVDSRLPVRDKLEPVLKDVWEKTRNGTWEMLKLVETLHPYMTQGIETLVESNRYTDSFRAFVVMNRLHFLHVSTDDINQVAYYPTLNHLRQGREVRTRLGRYLTKYQEALKLSDADIKSMTEKHIANMRGRGGWEVKFVEHDNPDGWVEVYNSQDVSSCMKGMEAVRIYAHEKSVLRLAYVQAGSSVVARCIVRESPDDSKGWLRVYPDHNGYAEGRFLLDYLKVNGYPNQTNLDDVLLTYEQSGGDVVCPYIDSGNGGDQTIVVDEYDGVKYLRAGGGEMSATNTNGFAENDMCSCDRCGDREHEDNMSYMECDGNNVCEYCRDEHYTYAMGARYEDYFPDDECIEVNGNWYHQDSIRNHDINMCEIDEEYYSNDDLVYTCDGVFHERHVTAIDHPDCHEYDYCLRDKVHTLSNGTTCHEDDADRLEAEIIEEQLEV